MALPWLEGEVFFMRNALVEPAYNFNPENAREFYGHMLIEHVWNRWTVSKNTSPNFNDIQRRPHPRSTLQIGRAQGGWNTYFGHFPDWWINFGNDRRGRNITRTFNAEPNQNRNEMRDLDAGGPAKVVFRPVPLGTEEFVFIDMTQPIRAVYFPIAHRTEERVPQLCTYLMVDFRLRGTIQLAHPVDGTAGRPIVPDRTWGLQIDVYRTLGIHIPSLIESISWPRAFRGEHADLYRSTPQGQETIFSLWDTDIALQRPPSRSTFVRYIDLAKIISAHQGIDLTYPPFQWRSFVVEMVGEVIKFGLGFVPGVGTLLSISFNVGFVLVTNPDLFRDMFSPSLGFEVVAGLIEAGLHFKRRLSPNKSLPNNLLPSPRQDFIFKDELGFKDRLPPLTSPKHAAGPPSDDVLSGHIDDSTVQDADDSTADDIDVSKQVI